MTPTRCVALDSRGATSLLHAYLDPLQPADTTEDPVLCHDCGGTGSPATLDGGDGDTDATESED